MERQKVTDYRPTLAERKLLEVLLNPELRTATVTDICQRAGQLTAGKIGKYGHSGTFAS